MNGTVNVASKFPNFKTMPLMSGIPRLKALSGYLRDIPHYLKICNTNRMALLRSRYRIYVALSHSFFNSSKRFSEHWVSEGRVGAWRDPEFLCSAV